MNKIQEEILQNYPSEICVRIVEIVLNKEPEWSLNLEELLYDYTKKVEEAVREEIAKEANGLGLFADGEDGDFQEGIKVGSELMKKDILRIISKK